MDSLITAAAHTLAAGDPLGALKRVALRNDAPALALRGIAMAQLGDFVRAKGLIRQATRAFGSKESVARARCIVAEAEIALASRELNWPARALDAACATLEAHGDRVNAAHARYLEIRRLVLIGRIADAQRTLEKLDPRALPASSRAIHELMVAGIELRHLHARAAREALRRAANAAREARIPALVAEIQHAARVLDEPAARLHARGEERVLQLDDVETLLASNVIVVDAIRLSITYRDTTVSLARRPVLFALMRALADAWPADLAREALIAKAFRIKRPDETHRARLRVEIGRLRKAVRKLMNIHATRDGFALAPPAHRKVVLLTPPVEEEHGALLALLADGESWSSSALALAAGMSQRTAQRALDALASAGKVQGFGRGRARRWTCPPLPGFATPLLLPPPVAGD